MTLIPCPPDEFLLALAFGKATRDEVKEHVESCSNCQGRVDQLLVHAQTLTDDPSGPAADRLPAPDPGLLVAKSGPSAVVPPEPGPTMIGKYVIVGLLGRGGQAVVYRAVHIDLQLDAVIKLAIKPLDAAGAQRNLFLDEGRLMADMRHENLIEVYDVDIHEGRPFLAMQLVRGCTLAQRAEQHRYTPKEAASVVAAVARAVAYLNGRGIVHQDIKPKNIMIDQEGRPRLIDFGMARLRDVWSDGTEGPVGGTPEYMAPEQALDEVERIGPATDVFALGSTLYFLLTGRAPNAGGTRNEVMRRARLCLVDREALMAPGIPKRLAQICQKALATDLAERPSASELAAQLDRFARGISRYVALAIPLVAAGVWWASYYWGALKSPVTPNPLHAGSTWAGTFFWTADATETRHSAQLKVTDQQGEEFSGIYDTENGQYSFRVKGSVHGDAVNWRFLEQLQGEPNPQAIERARVEGRLKGDDIHGRYVESSDIALMELHQMKTD